MKITHAERFVLNLPFENPRVERHMQRANTHGERVTAWRVETDAGIVGYGEGGGDEARVIGKNPFELLNEDSIGGGLHTALYDIAGKAEGVPAYRLMGPKVRDFCPISWWAIDMPPEDWAEEAKTAVRLGYTSFKLKARPWQDIFAQVEAIGKVVPPGFLLDVDFNAFLLNSGNAIPILRELEKNEHVSIFEQPIPQEDVDGYKQIRQRITKSISLHFGSPPIATTIHENICDGFVLGGSVMEARRQGTIAAMANKPFWLQMVGAGIMTAFTVHLGAVLSHARWPAITCHELWVDDLLKERLEVKDGYIRVPEAPGLGVEVDEEALERYRVDPQARTPKDEYLQKRRVLKIRWPRPEGSRAGRKEGPAWCFTSESDYQRSFYSGNMPLFVRGVTLEVIEDDGSAAFTRLYERVKGGDVRE
jgi:L-alanine-DL-glutamate epimerase-like enolase superfamily enzyme